MNNRIKTALLCALVATSGFAMHANAAEENVQLKDPPRWQMEDVTPRARFNNMKKEATAAYQQSLNECKTLRNSEAAACRHDAKVNFDNDMQRAHRILEHRNASQDDA